MVCGRRESDEVCAGKRNRETGAQSETWKEWGWFNLLSKPWNGIGVIGESKIYLCQAALHSPCLWHSNTILTKKAISPASLHTVEQNDLQFCSSCGTTASDLSWDQCNNYKETILEYLQLETVQKSVWNNTHPTASTVQIVPFIKSSSTNRLLYSCIAL